MDHPATHTINTLVRTHTADARRYVFFPRCPFLYIYAEEATSTWHQAKHERSPDKSYVRREYIVHQRRIEPPLGRVTPLPTREVRSSRATANYMHTGFNCADRYRHCLARFDGARASSTRDVAACSSDPREVGIRPTRFADGIFVRWCTASW